MRDTSQDEYYPPEPPNESPDGYCDEFCSNCKTTRRCSFVIIESGWAQVTCLTCENTFRELTNEI